MKNQLFIKVLSNMKLFFYYSTVVNYPIMLCKISEACAEILLAFNYNS